MKANYQGRLAKEINSMFKWLNQLDHQRWIPPALYYLIQNWRQPDLVLHFLTDLERLAVSFMIRKVPPYKRFEKNIEAENFNFDTKKEKYFSTSRGISPFVITTQVLRCREWTPTVIEQRQSELLGTLKQLWRL